MYVILTLIDEVFLFDQSDVCHAYQVLRRGGLKEENIVVFMYDDIAFNEENPRPGVIINSPHGDDVYKGVPKVVYLCFSVSDSLLLCFQFKLYCLLIWDFVCGRIT